MTDSPTTVSEQTTEITLRVNGVNRTAVRPGPPPPVGLPAPRPAPHRHPRRLRARRLRRVHGPRRRPADALVPDVRRHRPGPRDHHRRGPARPTPSTMSPVQQAFTECHGLQCGFCTPGFLTTITAYLRRTRTRRSEEAREAISGNLCRCTGYQNIVKSVLRAAEITKEREASVMTTKMFGAPVQRKEDPRLLTGDGRYLDDLGHDALAAAFVRSPHAHARILDIDVTDALDVEGVVGDLHARGPGRQGGRAAAAADPAPDADQRPMTGYCLAPERGQPRRRAGGHGRRDRPLRRRGRLRADPGRLRAAARRRRVWSMPAPATCSSTTDVPGNVAAHMVQEVGDADAAIAARPAHADPRPRHRAQRLHADGGQGRLRPLGQRRGVAAALLLHADHHRRAGGRRRQARAAPGQGRVHRPRRGWRLRRQDHAPVARGGPRAVGRPSAEPRRQVGRGPARALHLLRPRARPAAGGRGRLRRRGPGARASSSSSGTTTAPTRRTASSSRSSPPPSCSGPTSPAPTGASSPRCSPTPSS